MASLIPKDISFNQSAIIINRDSNDISQKDLIYQNGEYKASASSIINEENAAFKAFDNNPDTYWICNNPTTNNPELKYKQYSYNGFVPSSYVGGGTTETYWKTIADNKQYLGTICFVHCFVFSNKLCYSLCYIVDHCHVKLQQLIWTCINSKCV